MWEEYLNSKHLLTFIKQSFETVFINLFFIPIKDDNKMKLYTIAKYVCLL